MTIVDLVAAQEAAPVVRVCRDKADAAWAAARAAARAALKPTVDQLQTSAIDLFSRMIDPSVSS